MEPIKNMKDKLRAVDMLFWRRFCEVTLVDRIRTESIKERMDVKTSKVKETSVVGRIERLDASRLGAGTTTMKKTRKPEGIL